MQNESVENTSYVLHENWYSDDLDLKKVFETKTSIDYWRHERKYLLTKVLHSTDNETWLTIGDGFGKDANWLESQKLDVEASDIADNILKLSLKNGYIKKYSKQNAENISYSNNSFDYVMCKEAYHHFPRPTIALYEMIRVSSKAVILIEPLDVGIQWPVLIAIKNILDRFNENWINKIWKNRFSFETVGNYVYKISEREIEKVAMGINLPYLAFKGLNDHYSSKIDLFQPKTNRAVFSKVKRKIFFRDMLNKIGLAPDMFLCAIIFKKKPTVMVMKKLKENGYKIIQLKKNPYM